MLVFQRKMLWLEHEKSKLERKNSFLEDKVSTLLGKIHQIRRVVGYREVSESVPVAGASDGVQVRRRWMEFLEHGDSLSRYRFSTTTLLVFFHISVLVLLRSWCWIIRRNVFFHTIFGYYFRFQTRVLWVSGR